MSASNLKHSDHTTCPVTRIYSAFTLHQASCQVLPAVVVAAVVVVSVDAVVLGGGVSGLVSLRARARVCARAQC